MAIVHVLWSVIGLIALAGVVFGVLSAVAMGKNAYHK
jgi:hypothetical protein